MELILSNSLLYKPNNDWVHLNLLIKEVQCSYFYLTYTWHCKFGLFLTVHYYLSFPSQDTCEKPTLNMFCLTLYSYSMIV